MQRLVLIAIFALVFGIPSVEAGPGDLPLKVFTVGTTGGTVAESSTAVNRAVSEKLGEAGLIGSEGTYALAITTARLTAGKVTFLVGTPKFDHAAKTITYTIAFTEEFSRTPPLEDVAQALVEDLKLRSEFAAMKTGTR